MSLTQNFSGFQENPTRTSKSVSTPSNVLGEEIRKQLLGRSRQTALKARSNETDSRRGFVSEAFKKPVFKAQTPRKRFSITSKARLSDSINVGSDGEYSDIEEMHLYPEPEDDFEGIIPKKDRLTREDYIYIMNCVPEKLKPLRNPKADPTPIDYGDLFEYPLLPMSNFELLIQPINDELIDVPLPDDDF